MLGVDVITEASESNPWCPHGPTLLFSRTVNNTRNNYFACSACRDRKLCSFFLPQEELAQYKPEVWKKQREKLVGNINHRKLFLTLNKIKQLSPSERTYCRTCSSFELKKFWEKHQGHDLATNLTDHDIEHPSEFLAPLENAKKEAQFLFSANSVEVIVGILKDLAYEKVICMGTPRIHEYIASKCPDMESILLDFDKRYHSFWGPLQFCWYNSFNHHFFLEQSKAVFEEFLNDRNVVLILDPPFGGRVEPLAHTLQTIKKQSPALPIFWVFPYFMEPQIVNTLPDFTMLDYKVDYDNHPLFQSNPKARKYGSPVRIFTNVAASKITLPAEDYKFCKKCNRWVYKENRHCLKCKACTSKDGRTYEHCDRCQRCVKPTWQHCETCDRCCQPEHKCGDLAFLKNCFHCKQAGHKKRDCPKVDQSVLQEKRKRKMINAPAKKKKNQ